MKKIFIFLFLLILLTISTYGYVYEVESNLHSEEKCITICEDFCSNKFMEYQKSTPFVYHDAINEIEKEGCRCTCDKKVLGFRKISQIPSFSDLIPWLIVMFIILQFKYLFYFKHREQFAKNVVIASEITFLFYFIELFIFASRYFLTIIAGCAAGFVLYMYYKETLSQTEIILLAALLAIAKLLMESMYQLPMFIIFGVALYEGYKYFKSDKHDPKQ